MPNAQRIVQNEVFSDRRLALGVQHYICRKIAYLNKIYYIFIKPVY